MADIDAYAQIDDFRLFIRAGDEPPAPPDPDDALMALALIGASRAIDRATMRTFRAAAAGATARYFTADKAYPSRLGGPFYVSWQPYDFTHAQVPISDLMTTTDLEVAFDTAGDRTYSTAVTDYWPAPTNAADEGNPWTLLVFGSSIVPPVHQEGIRVTAKWGWTAIPEAVTYATMLQAASMFKRRDAPFGIAGSPDMGNEMRLLAKLDPDVMNLIGPYKRRWGAV